MNEPENTFDLHPNVKNALIHPQKGMEMRGWLKKNPDKALHFRGETGETMMHWAFLSDSVFASDLLQVGLSFEDKDNLGRTPFDWLTDRLFGAILSKKTNLSKGGQERLLRQSMDLFFALWGLGARPSDGISSGKIWLSAGAFETIPLFVDAYGADNWLPEGATLLHALVLSPNTPKRALLASDTSRFVDINKKDIAGRTPLWYVTDTWLKHEDKRSNMVSLAHLFLRLGANKDIKDEKNFGPLDIITFDQNNQDMLNVLSGSEKTGAIVSL